MSDKIQKIWPVDSGIADIECDWKELQETEVASIREVWMSIRSDLQGTPKLEQFTERLSREWAIETGVLENLYELTRGVTVILIEHGFQAELIGHGESNKSRDYVVNMLKDQKDALDGVFDFVSSRRQLSTSYIKEVHAALLRSQKHVEALDSQGNIVETPLLRGTWKEQPNHPSRDGVVYQYCPPEHVSSEMDRLVKIYNEHIDKGTPPEVNAAWLHHRFTQIHPFQDGNGRVARTLASLVFIKDNLFPLVVTRDHKPMYIDALELADSGNLQPLVQLFSKLQRLQFLKATKITESVLADSTGIDALIEDLGVAAGDKANMQVQEMHHVFDHAKSLADCIENKLIEIKPGILNALMRFDRASTIYTNRSNLNNDYWFRAQIIQNAKDHLGYFANISDYRSWVSLNLSWTRKAKLVFAFHGIGKPFSGSLVCAPFLEFHDQDDETNDQVTLIPLAEEPFMFFFSDAAEDVKKKFDAWATRILAVFLNELKNSL